MRFVLFTGVLLLCSCVNFPLVFEAAIGGVEGDIDELLDVYTDSQRDFGCDARLLIDGGPSYQAFLDLIENARDHINIETLDFDNDTQYEQDIALEFALLLVDKVRQGVQVNVILDPLLQQFYGRPELVQIMRDGGVNVLPYIAPDKRGGLEPLLFRTHKKLLIADGERAIIGGMNFGYLYLARSMAGYQYIIDRSGGGHHAAGVS
ncbi:MAG: phospholipase D-like domain-containing protein [Planctomycetota bacterium]